MGWSWRAMLGFWSIKKLVSALNSWIFSEQHNRHKKKDGYDSFLTRVIKGKKETIQTHAESKGESMNGFVNRAIDETMERDKGE